MMNQMIGRLSAAGLQAVMLYASAGCNEATVLGQNLVPGSDLVNTQQTDTFTVQTRTFYRPDDSVIANYQTETSAGAINSDPTFGKTTAITYAQIGLSSPAFTFSGPSPILDSIVLAVAYSGYYGDSMAAQKFTAYRITDPAFNDTTLYYKHQQFPVDGANPLGTVSVSAHALADSVSINGTMEAPQLRIRLSTAFGNDLMQQSGAAAFTNDSAFHSWLNGLAIIPDSTTGGRKSIFYLQLNSAYTGISVYYHTSTADSLEAFFPFNASTCGFSNYVHRNYTGSVASQHFADTTSSKGDSLIYLQNKPGLFANIDIPYLQDFPNAIINKAELVITQVPDAGSDVYTAPDYLFLWQYKGSAQDTLGYIYDVGASISQLYGTQLTNLAYFGGAKKIITNEAGQRVAQYRISITRYLQHLISANPLYKEANHGFRLVVLDARGSSRDVGRVVLGGGNRSGSTLKLQVVYTKIK
jgi:hypothetical protein